MKFIPAKELAEMLSTMNGVVSESQMVQIFEEYGDDYYKDDSYSEFKLVETNKKRKELICSYISLKMEHVNTDGTKGESVTAEVTQEEYDKIIEYLMR